MLKLLSLFGALASLIGTSGQVGTEVETSDMSMIRKVIRDEYQPIQWIPTK